MNVNVDEVDAIFCAAIELPTPAERADYLTSSCGENADLRRRVEELLAAHFAAGSFLDARQTVPHLPHFLIPYSAGSTIGPYKLLEQIGEGGMGVVFKAEQSTPVQRTVALKIIKPGMDTRQVIARFEAERQALAVMDHPNIARVFDAGTTEMGLPYFVMELVQGVPITRYCDEHRLPPSRRLELFIAVCQAVQHAHQKGIIHRDLKPSNILVSEYDGRPVVKIIDFGVAKAIEQPLTKETLLTEVGQVLGTIEYMSPEQAKLNQLDIDTRTDIYSLGVLLYELLTGTTPFDARQLRSAAFDEMLRTIREVEPPRPSTRLSSSEALPSIAANRGLEPGKLTYLVRGDLDWIALKALDKDRERRYETANGLAIDVERYLGNEPVAACPPSRTYRFRKFAGRNRGTLVALTAVTTALVLGAGISIWQAIRATIAEERAVHNAIQADTNAAAAEANEKVAKENEQIAKSNLRLANRRFYAAQMNLAVQAWQAGDPVRTLDLLEGQRPQRGEDDLRGFEWYYLWRCCNSGRMHLHGHVGPVDFLAFSPDSKTLVSATFSGKLWFWDVATAKLRHIVNTHDNGHRTVAFAPDGNIVASSGQLVDTLSFWDPKTGRPIRSIPEHVWGKLIFSDNGTSIAGGLQDERGFHAKIWDVASGEERLSILNAGLVVGFHSKSNLLATLANRWTSDSEIRFWNSENGDRRLAVRLPGVGNAVVSPDGTNLVTNRLDVLDAITGKPWTHISIDGNVTSFFGSISYSPDGKSLAAAQRRTVSIWDLKSGKLLAQDAHLDKCQAVSFSPDGRLMASGSLSGAIKLWDMTPVEDATTIPVTDVQAIQFSPDGRTLLVGTAGPTQVFDVATGLKVALLPVDNVSAISSDANVLAARIDDEYVSVWNVKSRRQTRRILLPEHSMSGPKFSLSPTGEHLIAYRCKGNKAQLWNVATGESQELDAPHESVPSVESAAFSSDSKRLAFGYRTVKTSIFDVATGRKLAQFYQMPEHAVIHRLAFAPNNQFLATASNSGNVRVWNASTGSWFSSMRGSAGSEGSLAFSRDGQSLATAGNDKVVKLWDVTTGQELCTLAGHSDAVHLVQFSHDGNTLATASEDGTIKLWRAATDQEARQVREVNLGDMNRKLGRE